jgi:unsaturated chondroitin disaccharide hydrolase
MKLPEDAVEMEYTTQANMMIKIPGKQPVQELLSQEDQQWLAETLKNVTRKMAWLSDKSADKIPFTTIDGVHDDKRALDHPRKDNGLQWWTNGFWAGMLWLWFHETHEEKYARIARRSEEWLDQCFDNFYGLHHDVGFMWLPSAVADYRLTGNLDSRRRGLHAANVLAGRFNPVGRFIRAWDSETQVFDTRGWAIIDCMLNIPLLYWASEETRDPRYRHIAMMHADTVADNFIRADGSSEHIVKFDPDTGEKMQAFRGQGYAEGTAWTRGQSWALYGFMMSYMHTGKPAYLETAKKVANHFIAHIPENGLIPIDFFQPSEPDYEDSSAAAIAACGLIEMASYVGKKECQTYLQAALKLLKTLSRERCDFSENQDHFLERCSGSYHEPNHHYALIYGDYYYIEALLKLKGSDLFLW